jgi:ATP-dependent exoDNAse (exonuclease V) beta subunit
VDSLRDLILAMFSDTETGKVRKDVVTLCSIHKSKGLEFEQVYLLGKSQFMPSKYAKQEWMLVQESNLEYVAVTRAKDKLVYVNDVPTGNKKPQAA